MAINIPIVTEFVDAGLKSAEGAFKNFRTQVGQAEGAMGKLKAGSGAAFDAIKANAGAMALGAGTAIAGFAVKAIGEFQNLALEVDKFSNATGLAAEEASRWVEVAGDIGIESSTLLTSFNKLNQAIGKGSGEFEKLGIEIAKTSGGATDVNQTFLNTIDALRRINDPATRARAATQLLGKSWTEVSELVEMGAGRLSTALEEVSGAKLIDEAEIQKAKDLRAAQDQLKDAFENITLVVGQMLVPVLTDVAELLGPLADKMAKAGDKGAASAGALENFAKWLGIIDDDAEDVVEVTDEMTRAWEDGYRAMIDAADATNELTVGLEDVDEALSILKGNVDERRQWDNLITAIEDAKDAAWQAFYENTPEALRESQRETDDARLKVAEYITQMDLIPPEKKTEMIAALDKANLEEIEEILNELARERQVLLKVRTVGGEPVGPGDTPSETVGVSPMSILSGRNSSVIVNVAGSVTSENDLVETIRQGLVRSQRNGAQLVYSNT